MVIVNAIHLIREKRSVDLYEKMWENVFLQTSFYKLKSSDEIYLADDST